MFLLQGKIILLEHLKDVWFFFSEQPSFLTEMNLMSTKCVYECLNCSKVTPVRIC